MRPRRNQRGPSTPRNRTGSSPPGRPPWTGSVGVIRATSSTPNGPSASAYWPPLLATSAAISCLTSSHRPPLLGAAKACSCRPLSPCMTVTQAGWFSTTLTWTSMPSPVGTSRLPKSSRSWSGTSSPASHGPASPAVPGPASPGPASPSPGLVSAAQSGASPGSPVSSRRRRNTVTHSLPGCFLAHSWLICKPCWPGLPLTHRLPRGVPAGGAKAAVRAGRARQRLHLAQLHAGDLLDDQLGDSVAALEADRVLAVGVEQGDPDLATVPCVHRARRVDQGDTVPCGEP